MSKSMVCGDLEFVESVGEFEEPTGKVAKVIFCNDRFCNYVAFKMCIKGSVE